MVPSSVSPMMASSEPSTIAARRRRSSSRRRRARARATTASRASGPTGFSRYANADSFIAPTALAIDPWPVTMMTGVVAAVALMARSTSRPDWSGSCRSSTTRSHAPRGEESEPGAGGGRRLHAVAVVVQHEAERVPVVGVVVDDEDPFPDDGVIGPAHRRLLLKRRDRPDRSAEREISCRFLCS